MQEKCNNRYQYVAAPTRRGITFPVRIRKVDGLPGVEGEIVIAAYAFPCRQGSICTVTNLLRVQYYKSRNFAVVIIVGQF